MRLPPSRTACRIAASRRGSVRPSRWSNAAASATSTRLRQRARVSSSPGPPGSGVAIDAGEGFGPLRRFGVGEQAYAQFGLLQRLLAAAVQAHAALVGGQRFLETHLAVLHLLDQLLELVERALEGGNGGGVGSGGI